MTSVRKRLDNVLKELDAMDTRLDEEAVRNVMVQLWVVRSAFRETEKSPMCCYRYNLEAQVTCDTTGPLELEQFMKKCRQCQTQIKRVLVNLEAD
jgi:hypothetical protein